MLSVHFFSEEDLISFDRLKTTFLLKDVSGLLSALQNNSIIIGSLAEVTAVIGILIAVSGGVKFDFYRSGAVALLIFLLNFPRKAL